MATISFIAKFDLTTTTPSVILTDTTDWAGQGINLADVNGSFKITSPSGIVIYDNLSDYTDGGCDIDMATSLVSQQTINITPEAGNYTIFYSVDDTNLAVLYDTTSVFNYEYVAPELCIVQAVDCISPKFTSTDSTDYDVAGITPTIVRTHTLYYPNGSAGQGSPLVSPAITIETGTFYNGVETTTITSGLTYVFADGLTIVDSLTGSKDATVDCTYICSIYCCIRALEQRKNNALGVNQVTYNSLLLTFNEVMAYVGLTELAINCSNPDQVNCYLEKIKTLTECNDDCDCGTDSTSRVTGLGGLVSETKVVSGGTPVVVTPSVVAEVTTYTVSLSTAFINSVISNTVTQDWEIGTDTIVGNPVTHTLSGLSVTIPVTGTYLVLFDAYSVVTTNFHAKYQFSINAVPSATDYKLIGFITGISPEPEQNMTLTKTEAFTAGDILTVELTAASIPDMTVDAKSIKLIRLF